MSFFAAKAGNGDSIFNMTYIHTIHITFPYPAFYDSLLNSKATDTYLKVAVQFNNESYIDVGIKAKGNSSFNNPSQKKSFKLDFNEFVQGQDIHGLKKLNFNNAFKDPSFMREKISNDFLIDHGIPAPRTTYCNVYLNNQLWGLYTIVEEIDDEFCQHWFNSNDGNLFKGDPHGDLKWKGSNQQSLYETEYELKNNSGANDWSDLISLIDIINNTPAATLQSSLDPRFNTETFMKQWAAMNMFSSLDAYIGSGHNYFIYHDTISNKFQWIAWDNNEAFGSFKNNLSSAQLINLDMYYLSNPSSRPLCNNMLLNANYKAMYQSAYCELKNDFTNNYFDPKIDSLKNSIQQSVYNDPKKFYPNSKFDSSFNYDLILSGPGGLTIFGIKKFIGERSIAIQNSLYANNVSCWALNSSEVQSTSQDVSLYPNPAETTLYISYNNKLESVVLYELSGKVLLEDTSGKNQIPLNSLPVGVYLVEINGTIRKKLLKN
ncbi:MAG: CotH kinase family protein [Bacteroidetes bacterium]|nr:CotH kinase family protein [Bacteroidota bacterium]